MFCVAKEPLSQRKNEITIFLQNYLYKTKVISIPSANKKRGIHSPNYFSIETKIQQGKCYSLRRLKAFGR